MTDDTTQDRTEDRTEDITEDRTEDRSFDSDSSSYVHVDGEVNESNLFRHAFSEELEHCIPNYFLRRCVLDRWILGETPLLSIREAHMQNSLDHHRMKIIDWRTRAQKLKDDGIRLQHILYTNQKVFAFVYAHLLQCVSVFTTKFIHKQFPYIQFHLTDSNTALEAVFHSGGKVIMNKSFHLHPYNLRTGNIAPAIAKIWVRMQVTDFIVDFMYKHRVSLKAKDVLSGLSGLSGLSSK